LSFKASVPTKGELKAKVGLLIAVVVDYSFRMDLTINTSSVTEYPFVANLSTIPSSLLKLSIQTLLYCRFFNKSNAFTGLI